VGTKNLLFEKPYDFMEDEIFREIGGSDKGGDAGTFTSKCVPNLGNEEFNLNQHKGLLTKRVVEGPGGGTKTCSDR